MSENEISAFRGPHDFLSNFYAADVELEGAEYPTIEHAFQAAKSLDFAERRAVKNAKTASEAKRMGRKIKRRADWFDVSLVIMENLVRQKFTRYPELGSKLLETGDADLIEGNNWNDRFYGAVYDTNRNVWMGENHLGKILMKVRDELKQEAK
ncbi:MAG: NADAR family protein [Anaerolineae bacterium]|nr:NADAR family protein [Anaerolineae bacterium]